MTRYCCLWLYPGFCNDSRVPDWDPHALHAHPLTSNKKDHGDRDLLVSFAGVNFKKDHFLYADMDGMIVSATNTATLKP
jgi:regulator of ribonuclease activity A